MNTFTPLTPEQLKAAALKLCEIRGIDPYSHVQISPKPDKYGFVPAVLIHTLAHIALVDEVERMWEDQFIIDFIYDDEEIRVGETE